jgi:hypothetical protein
MVHRLIRGLVRARFVVALLFLLAVVGGGYAFSQSGPPSSSPAMPTGFNLSLPGPKRAPDATENYLKGNQMANVDLLWSSLSDEAIERYRARGVGRQELQRQLNIAQERGAKLEQINYIGGQSLPDGTSMQFYLVAARGPAGRTDLEFVTYIFTLDRAGKIVKVQ